MQVVHYEEPEQWFLLEEDGQLFIDVRCSSGFTDFSRVFPLSDEERAGYEREGMPFLNRLNERARDAVSEEFTRRDLPQFWHDKSHDAIIAWRTENGTLVPMPPVATLSLEELMEQSRQPRQP